MNGGDWQAGGAKAQARMSGIGRQVKKNPCNVPLLIP